VPTIFSHAIVATAAGQWFSSGKATSPESPVPSPGRFWMWTAACAMLPDTDVIGFSFGIRYDDMFGHRGFTHSVFFAALTGIVVASVVVRRPSKADFGAFFLWFTAVTLSHGVLDAMTNGGRGIGFLAPFSNHRYFFPWRPIQVSPIGAGFFSPRGLGVLVSECGWIWLPSAIMAAFARLFKKG
jgi:inner membrane protein